MVARFGIAKQTLLITILFFPLSFLKKRRSTLLQCKIINAGNGNPGLFGNWFFGGNSMECIGVETYFASTADTPTDNTINQGTEKRWDTTLIRVLFKLETYANFLVSP